MKLYTSYSLLTEIRRHIQAKSFTFTYASVTPFVHSYFAESENKRQFTFFSEETYSAIINTAIRARKANPTDIDAAENDFCTLVKTIETPEKTRVYTLANVAQNCGLNVKTAHLWLTTLKEYPFSFIETNSGRFNVLDEENYRKALEFTKANAPKPRPKTEEPVTEPVKEPMTEQVYRYTTLDTLYKALSDKFGMDSSQTRSCLNGLRDFVPMCRAKRGTAYEGMFTVEVADALVKAVGDSSDSRDFVKRAINMYDHPETTELYTLTDIGKTVGHDFHLHDYAPLFTFALSLDIGGLFDRDRRSILFTAEEKEQFIEAYRQKYVKPEPPKAEPQPKLEPIAQPKTADGLVHISINGLDLKLGRVEALKIAQSIMNQLA